MEIKEMMNKGLSINRMPGKTYNDFVGLAKEEFCGDYGFALKMLMDLYNGLINTGVEHLEVGLNDLNNRLNALETGLEKRKEKKKVMICGKEK